jgi:anti-anti-sigma regulatory factor
MTASGSRQRGQHLATIDVGTELTAATAADVRAAVSAGIDGFRAPTHADAAVVRVLLRDVVRHDVVGLGLLLGLHRAARSVGVLLMCVDPSPSLLGAMRRHGLHRVLAVETNLREPDDGEGVSRR